MNPQTIDVHAHILTEDTIRLLQRESPKVAPKLTDVDEQFGTLDVAGNVYRHFPRGGWDLDRRFRTWRPPRSTCRCCRSARRPFVYAQPPALAAAFARIQNEQLAKLVKAHPGRFLAIATRPDAGAKQAADELRHAMSALGLRGAQIGSNIAGKNLDDPELEPVWATAAELGAFILIHPINVAGIDRLSSYYLNNLIGNPLDTTIAAACLVFSGVLERYPSLKILPVPWRRLRALPGRPLPARLACARRAEDEAAEAADRLAPAVLLRHHRAFEGGARIPGRQRRRRPRAARQRLSIRHGHARRRAAGPQPFDPARPTSTSILGGLAQTMLGASVDRPASRAAGVA